MAQLHETALRAGSWCWRGAVTRRSFWFSWAAWGGSFVMGNGCEEMAGVE
jgi:hypothetical protein